MAGEFTAERRSSANQKEVIKLNGNDTSLETIRFLFFRQIKNMTMMTNGIDTFDVQFSDQWLR